MSNQITGDSLELLFEMLDEEELMESMFDAETDNVLAEVCTFLYNLSVEQF